MGSGGVSDMHFIALFETSGGQFTNGNAALAL